MLQIKVARLTALTLTIIGAAALTSCGGSTAPTPAAEPQASAPVAPKAQDTGSQTMSAEEAQVLREVNAARAVPRTCGDVAYAAAAPVAWNGFLAVAARAHTADMAARNYFAHISPEGGTLVTRAEAAGYTTWRELGENIAAGYTVQNVVQGWIDSPGHCKNLMDPKFKEMGAGYTYRTGSTFGTYWAQEFGTR
ncbi:CAP domain-containing protein [Deinococcus sp. Arct2-2]|uniref:CAP domain-containing protein n=1 Tax=Deinococcus sp. Arct2-2 TaxID=2568653 RepID=UPI0010A47FF4|nr:CAP domain-containing protein [Deinococcus sp. Arct2-2]THF71810.1 CAP domain-containing protein [Deinococcus sp. Arct2-2]